MKYPHVAKIPTLTQCDLDADRLTRHCEGQDSTPPRNVWTAEADVFDDIVDQQVENVNCRGPTRRNAIDRTEDVPHGSGSTDRCAPAR